MCCRPHSLGPGYALRAFRDDRSALLRYALRRWINRQREPGVAGLLPYRRPSARGRWGRRGCRWRRRRGRGSRARPVDGGAAVRAEAEGERVAALGGARVLGGGAGEGDLLAAEAGLVADDGAGAALALQAVAHGDARGLAFDGERELPAGAGGAAGGRGHGGGARLRGSIDAGDSVAGFAAEALPAATMSAHAAPRLANRSKRARQGEADTWLSEGWAWPTRSPMAGQAEAKGRRRIRQHEATLAGGLGPGSSLRDVRDDSYPRKRR